MDAGNNPVGTDEQPERSYRGKVHGNCVTVHKASRALHFILLSTVLGDTSNLPRDTSEGTITANGIVLAATGKCGRRLIGARPAIAFSLLVPNNVRARENICTHSGYAFASAAQRKEHVCSRRNASSGRVIYPPVEMKRK